MKHNDPRLTCMDSPLERDTGNFVHLCDGTGKTDSTMAGEKGTRESLINTATSAPTEHCVSPERALHHGQQWDVRSSGRQSLAAQDVICDETCMRMNHATLRGKRTNYNRNLNSPPCQRRFFTRLATRDNSSVRKKALGRSPDWQRTQNPPNFYKK